MICCHGCHFCPEPRYGAICVFKLPVYSHGLMRYAQPAWRVDGSMLQQESVEVTCRTTCVMRALPGQESWVYQTAKRPHSHDVRVLLMLTPAGARPLMVSAGVDTQLMVHAVRDFAQQHPTRVSRVPQPPLICCPLVGRPGAVAIAGGAGAAAFLYAAEREHVDVWRVVVAPRVRRVRRCQSPYCNLHFPSKPLLQSSCAPT